jgi:protein SCO1/2
MDKTSPRTERLVWGGLILVALVIVGAFVFSKFRTRPALPVFGQVPSFVLTNQNGQAVSRQNLDGKIWVADIIFTRCPTQCLKMSRQMSELQPDIAAGDEVKLVSLTADPTFDTPPVLKIYGSRFGAGDNRWIFLTGDKASLYGLAIEGLKLSVAEKLPAEREAINDLFIHSTRFVLVDRQGRIRGWFDGNEPGLKEQILRGIQSLKAEK